MSKTVYFLDSGVLSDILFPGGSDEARRCSYWFEEQRSDGVSFRIPILCYYEVRRLQVINSLSLQHSEERRGYYAANVKWLDQLCSRIGIEKIDAKTMRIASRLWAEAHVGGYPTATKQSLDADVLIAASALRLSRGERDVVIITKNVRHLARYASSFVTARR